MTDLTPDRLQELRRIAEAATPGPLTMHLCDDARYAAFVDAPHLGPDAPELAVFLTERDARFFAEFDRDTVLAMLDEIERLRREREVMEEVLKAVHERDRHIHTCDHCECATCPEGTELSYKAYIAQWIYSKGSVGA